MRVMLQLAHILLAKDIVAASSNLRHAGLDPQPPAQACTHNEMLPNTLMTRAPCLGAWEDRQKQSWFL